MLLAPLFRSGGLTVWCLNLTGRPIDENSACVYAILLYDRPAPEPPFVYIGQSRRFPARIRSHIGTARAYARCRRRPAARPLTRRLAEVRRRTRSLLVLALANFETPGPELLHCEVTWQLAAALQGLEIEAGRLSGPGARGDSEGLRGQLREALALPWPQTWIEALAPYFRLPQQPGARVLRLSDARARRLVAASLAAPPNGPAGR